MRVELRQVTGIVDSASLQSAVIEYLARDQDTVLIARIPSFIQMFEAKVNRSLFARQMESRAQAQTDPAVNSEPEYIALPADFQTMRRMRVTSGSRQPPLTFLSGTQIDEMRFSNADVSGTPQYFSIFGNEIELFPTPAAITTVEMIYRQNLPSLNANATNWLLALAPDAYLYGALLESAPYIKQDARIQVWGAAVQSALSDLNSLGNNSAFNAGPMQVRTTSKVW
jgi:hypothetical protein